MADATVSQGRRDEAIGASAELTASTAPRVAVPATIPFVLLWAAFVAGSGAFIAFGTVRVGAGNWFGWRMSVRQIWSRFMRFLTEEGAGTGTIVAVSGAAVIALIGCAVLLWLAFTLRDQPSEPTAEDVLGR